MRGKVYISDEGFGPIVRQHAIISELRRIHPSLDFTVQTETHIEQVRRIMPDLQTISKFNNISWAKAADGTPDIPAIQNLFQHYEIRSKLYIASELLDNEADFIISDFVYEAFEVGEQKKIPSFGVAHFTWDWFFSKLYPLPITTSVLDRFFRQAALAKRIYFPPFTPPEIKRYYKDIATEVPLIVRKNIKHKTVSTAGKFNVLLIDSGAGVLEKSILKALSFIGLIDDCHFYVSSSFNCSLPNVTLIDKNELFINYISDMDLVIGRAGFNTISECIAMRTPMLLLSEGMNPEMNENMIAIKNEGLGSFISIKQFEEELHQYLPRFIKNEYKQVHYNMQNHAYTTNGAEVIAADILNRLS